MQVSVESRFRASLSGLNLDRPGLLALDTSTDRATVVLWRFDGACFEAPPGVSRQHGRGLVGAVRDLILEAGLKPADLAAIGVGLGPGSFTGLRIGITAAKTLAYAVGCKLAGFDSLEAIALGAAETADRVAAVGDAQRGDLFVADFLRGLEWTRLGPTRLERVDSWPASLEPGTCVIGPDLGRAEPSWPDGIIRVNEYPKGANLLALTCERIEAGEFLDPWFVEPSYVRRSAAEEKAWPTA